MLHMKWSVCHAGKVVCVLGSLGMLRIVATVCLAATTTASKKKSAHAFYLTLDCRRNKINVSFSISISSHPTPAHPTRATIVYERRRCFALAAMLSFARAACTAEVLAARPPCAFLACLL